MPNTRPQPSGIGVRLKTARQERRLSQSELADRVGLSQSTIAQWESGHHSPRPSHLDRVAAALAANRKWLETGIGPQTPSTEPQRRTRYIDRPLQHAPIIAPPPGALLFDPLSAPVDDYWPVSMDVNRPFVMRVRDLDAAGFAPETALVICDNDVGGLMDGALYVFAQPGRPALRRWRDTPPRYETPAGVPELVGERPRALGRAAGIFQPIEAEPSAPLRPVND